MMKTVGQDLIGDEDVATLSGCRRHLEGAFWGVFGEHRKGRLSLQNTGFTAFS
jgi:hypothetical protein